MEDYNNIEEYLCDKLLEINKLGIDIPVPILRGNYKTELAKLNKCFDKITELLADKTATILTVDMLNMDVVREMADLIKSELDHKELFEEKVKEILKEGGK